MVASEMGSKPYLILEIDAHTADAGVQTRLERFLILLKITVKRRSARAVDSTRRGSSRVVE
jgi:predicted nucleotide-binding protein (sugar kinase/HSP70/actin superfamily)